jgi:hypothetical protein
MAKNLHEWLPAWLKEILQNPTCSIPDAGRAIGIPNRTASYVAASKGHIPTIPYGRNRTVPTAWLRKQLMIDD